MSKRNITALEATIKLADDGDFERQLGLQLGMAKRLLEQLRRIEKLRHEIMKMDARTVAEIKSYTKPPPAVQRVMASTLRLLGESENNLRVCVMLRVFVLLFFRKSQQDNTKQFWNSETNHAQAVHFLLAVFILKHKGI